MIRQRVVEAIVPTPERVLELIVCSEQHRKLVWTAGRVLKEAALWTRAEELDHDERKLVLKRVAGLLEDLASQGILQRRSELQGIGFGSEVGFDYLRSRRNE